MECHNHKTLIRRLKYRPSNVQLINQSKAIGKTSEFYNTETKYVCYTNSKDFANIEFSPFDFKFLSTY